MQVAALEFKDYASVWWDQTIKERRRYGDPPIETWEEMIKDRNPIRIKSKIKIWIWGKKW